MKIFKDNDGRDWTIAVNTHSAERVKEMAEVDLFSILDGKLVPQFEADPALLVNVIYALCKPEADGAGVTDEKFAARLTGDAIDRATAALLGDLIDFFPKAKRELTRKAVEKHQAMWAEGTAVIHRKLDALDPVEEIRQAFGDSSIKSPASSASTPAR